MSASSITKRLRNKLTAGRMPFLRKDSASVFTDIYRHNYWGDDESVSGPGSSLARTSVIRARLSETIEKIGAASLLDAACGDFNWLRHVDLGELRYIGADIVSDLVVQNNRAYGNALREFVLLDITRDPLPPTDAILCRDCFIHLSFADIQNVLSNFQKSECEYLLATTHTQIKENHNIASGDWRSVNLLASPFNLPTPLDLVVENVETGKALGLWRLEDLRTI